MLKNKRITSDNDSRRAVQGGKVAAESAFWVDSNGDFSNNPLPCLVTTDGYIAAGEIQVVVPAGGVISSQAQTFSTGMSALRCASRTDCASGAW